MVSFRPTDGRPGDRWYCGTLTLQTGIQIGRYVLLRLLSSWAYIQSWRARGDDGQDYVLRIFHSTYNQQGDGKWYCGFDGMPHTFQAADDLRQYLVRYPADDVRTLMALPRHSNLAPLLNYELLNWKDAILGIVSRRFYPERLTDRFPANSEHPPLRSLLEIFFSLAQALDFLQDHMPNLNFDLAPGDLLLDGDTPVIADYALSKYNNSMDSNNRMWSSRVEHENRRSLVSNYSGTTKTEALYALATLYVYLRSRKMIFEDPTAPFPTNDDKMQRFVWLDGVFKNARKYEETGVLSLPMLSDVDERAVVSKALMLKRSDRYPSCRSFVEALRVL